MAFTVGPDNPQMSDETKEAYGRLLFGKPAPPQPWHRRLRSRIWWAFRDAREWLGFKIAGYDPYED